MRQETQCTKATTAHTMEAPWPGTKVQSASMHLWQTAEDATCMTPQEELLSEDRQLLLVGV